MQYNCDPTVTTFKQPEGISDEIASHDKAVSELMHLPQKILLLERHVETQASQIQGLLHSHQSLSAEGTCGANMRQTLDTHEVGGKYSQLQPGLGKSHLMSEFDAIQRTVQQLAEATHCVRQDVITLQAGLGQQREFGKDLSRLKNQMQHLQSEVQDNQGGSPVHVFQVQSHFCVRCHSWLVHLI